MRTRTWLFTVLVAVLLAGNLVLVSTRIAQTGEDTVRARLVQAGTALRAQLELVDARLSPRAAAEVPELAEATRAGADPSQPAARPDDRALRAAASALAPEPDLLAVVNAQGALVSRRSRPVQPVADVSQLPLARAALERTPAPVFAVYEGTPYRLAAARVPGNSAAVVAGTAADDRLAAQLKSQIDADVTLISNGQVLASSLSADERPRVLEWAAAPGPGYGVLPVVLPGIGGALSGRLPRGTSRYAVRGTLVPLDGGVQAALTVPASPYAGWLARYQAFYLFGLALFVLSGLLWGLLTREREPAAAVAAAPRPQPRARRLVGTDAGEARSAPEPPAGDVPWSDAAEAPVAAEPSVVLGDVDAPAGPTWEAAARAQERTDEGKVAEAEPPPPALAHPAVAEGAPSEAAVAEEAVAEPRSDSAADAAGSSPEAAAASVPPRVDSGAAANSDFSFAGLLDDAAAPTPRSPHAGDSPAPTTPDAPHVVDPPAANSPPDGLRLVEPDAANTPPHGLRPVEPAAANTPPDVLGDAAATAAPDELRAADAAERLPVQQGEREWAAAVDVAQRTTHADVPDEAAPPLEAPTAPPAEAFALAEPLDAADADEAHWREIYEQFIALKQELGEPGRISYEKFAAKLAKNREELMNRRQCRGVRFSVYEKDGRASIKASAVR